MHLPRPGAYPKGKKELLEGSVAYFVLPCTLYC